MKVIFNLHDFLDSYLVRVVELALTSSNRQTKVVACEFLHALILYMLGVSVSKTYERNKSVSNLCVLFNVIFVKNNSCKYLTARNSNL